MNTQTPIPASIDAPKPSFPDRNVDDLSTYLHRQLIGALGLLLPFLLWLIAGLRPMAALPRWEPLTSISDYYYTGAVAAFVGILVALAAFLFTYDGYDNAYHLRDRVAAILAGLAALLVAFFPTEAPPGLPVPSWWTAQTGTIHYFSAVVLFVSFVFFCFFQFPKSSSPEPLPRGKQVRNTIYYVCGGAILASLLWAGISTYTGAPIFWPEALALEFFAVSWLVKGRVDKTPVAAGRWIGHFARHPGQLAGRLRGTFRV